MYFRQAKAHIQEIQKEVIFSVETEYKKGKKKSDKKTKRNSNIIKKIIKMIQIQDKYEGEGWWKGIIESIIDKECDSEQQI